MADQIPIWMIRFHKQDADEERFQGYTPIKLLQPRGRNFIWWLCRQYNMVKDGVIGQACNFLERVLAIKIQQMKNLPPNSRQRYILKNTLIQRVPLLSSVCIAIASKMLSAENQLNVDVICDFLASYRVYYTVSEVYEAELSVLVMHGFNIPMFTNVEKALMIGTDLGMSMTLLRGLVIVTEIAELYRSVVQEHILNIAFRFPGNNHINRQDVANIRHIHLVAGAVVATALFFNFERDTVPRLAFLTDSSQLYVKSMGYFVHLCVRGIAIPMENSRKRKRQETEN